MRKNGVLTYLLGDHLGSTSLATDASGNVTSQQKYKPWGETRDSSGSEATKYQFTGQFSYAADFGLMYYGARFYDPSLGRFASADSIVPAGVQGYDRYAYVNNNPVNYTDPSGYMAESDDEGGCNTPGSPRCIIDRYGYNSSEMDRELENYYRAYPSYDIATDSLLEGASRVIVAAAFSRVGCDNGSEWACVSWAAGALFSPGPTGTGGFLTPTNNNSVPSNLTNDVYSSGGWTSSFPSQEGTKFISSPNPKIYGPGTQLYRLHNGNMQRPWWTLSTPKSEMQFRMDYAYRPEWGETNYMSVYTIPEKSFVQGWEGSAEYQGGFYVGGATQVYLPYIHIQWTTTVHFPP